MLEANTLVHLRPLCAPGVSSTSKTKQQRLLGTSCLGLTRAIKGARIGARVGSGEGPAGRETGPVPVDGV